VRRGVVERNGEAGEPERSHVPCREPFLVPVR
jgi:hypothetical protein